MFLNRKQLMECLKAFDDPRHHRISSNGEEQVSLWECPKTGDVFLSDETKVTHYWDGKNIGRAHNECDDWLERLK